ncbi:YkgJ family cysteine cluster protein [Massilia sp. IC2-476]|uniref:YkgJ family cysteine cluster protein n=1 Tax=Massilia sp. IC2-476 TaxID=2887199 RepID=UPI001D115754|nr:YkgJ family cysteine cluster protein [Massilia sp. IC2-476]MCC2972131.1 YkgJ family cysteine cluster protein [Massilia sp. IC2-476]
MSDHVHNPCLDCGACCKSFRVSFYWAEGRERGLPDGWTEQVTPHISCMKGTNASAPYCAALGKGDAGPMACGVYGARPSACREVEIGDEKCLRARGIHGMTVLAVHASATNPAWTDLYPQIT